MLLLPLHGIAADPTPVAEAPAAPPPAQPAQPPSDARPAEAQADFDSARSRLLARIKDRWSDQIQRSTQVRDATPLDLRGADGSPAVHGGYVATAPKNPLIDESCRLESLADAVAHWGHAHGVSEDEAFANRDAHIRELQGTLSAGPTFSAWIAHVATCKDFCLIAVRDLLACHVQAVAAHPHALVYFGVDSDRIEPGSGSAPIDSFVARLRDAPGKRILLIGRASRLGLAGPAYNRALSQRRTDAVREALAARGVAAGRIQMLSIGYEEPQLTESIAEIYRITDDYRRIGESGINQSVVMVLY